MGRSPVAFACAPAPAPDELLGSWLCRVATGHGVTVARFMESAGAPRAPWGDLDWRCPNELLQWLARGSGRSQRELSAMTLSVRFPEATRAAFAMSAHPSFPGGHAFCPLCEADDLARWGQPIMRCAHPGVFRLTCDVHRVFLDGADHVRELEPRRDRAGRWRSSLRARPARLAPKFALAFERALERASRGRYPGPAWFVDNPAAFVAIVRQLAALVMVQRRAGVGVSESAALMLLDERDLRRPDYGATSYDPDYIHRATTWPRTRSLAAAALLLVRPVAAQRLQVDAWARCCITPFSDWREWLNAPWRVASEAWGRDTFNLVRELSQSWPGELRAAVDAQLSSNSVMWSSERVGPCQESRRTV